jgi:hypothetical protein
MRKKYDKEISGNNSNALRLTNCMRFAALRVARAPKNRSRPLAFMRFFSATFGEGVNAPHCPITRPKRRIQSER